MIDDVKRRDRTKASPDQHLLFMLKSGNEMALQMALSNPTQEALAALEETIALYTNNPNVTFYQTGGQRVYTQDSVQLAKKKIMEMASSDSLLADPAHTQSLIAGLGSSPGVSNSIMKQLAINPQVLYDYQLLGVHMQLATILDKADDANKTADDNKMDQARIEMLIKDLASDSIGKKINAEAKLAEMGEKAVPLLIKALQNIDQRVGAGGALAKIGKPAVKPLLKSLNDTEWRVRFVAAHTLGYIHAKEAVEPLIGLLHDPQPDVRKYAAEALGRIGDERAEQPLRERLQYEDSMLAISGINEALSNLRENIIIEDNRANDNKPKQIDNDAGAKDTQKGQTDDHKTNKETEQTTNKEMEQSAKKETQQDTSNQSEQKSNNASEQNASNVSKQYTSNDSGQKASEQISKKKAVVIIAAIAVIALIAITLLVVVLVGGRGGEQTPGTEQALAPGQIEEAEAEPDAMPTPQSLQVSDIVGIWQLGEFDGEEFVLRDEFIEFTETEMITLNTGETEPYTLENSAMVLYSLDYIAAYAEDEDLLILASLNADGPLIIAQGTRKEEMAAYTTAPQVIDSAVLTNKKWNFTEHVVTLGADVDKMPLYECMDMWFGEDGTFRTSHSKGTFDVKDDTLILFFTSAGQRHIFYITIDAQKSEGVYNMTLTTEDRKAAFSFRAYEKK